MSGKFIIPEEERQDAIQQLERFERDLSELDLTGLAAYALWLKEHDNLFGSISPELGEGYKALLRKVVRETIKGLDMKRLTGLWELSAKLHRDRGKGERKAG